MPVYVEVEGKIIRSNRILTTWLYIVFNTISWHSCMPHQAEQPEEDVTDLRSGKQVVTKFHTHQRLQESNSPEGKYNTDLKIVPAFCLFHLAPSDGQRYVIAKKRCLSSPLKQTKKKNLKKNAYPNTQHCVPTRLH